MESEKIEKREHTLKFEKGRLQMTGVAKVERFSDKEVCLRLDGKMLVVRGQNLNVSELVIASGAFGVTGEIQSLTYSDSAPAGGAIKRLFK